MSSQKQNAFESLHQTLQKDWHRYHECLLASRDAPKTKRVHDLRTAVRRTNALLELLNELEGDKAPAKLRKRFKRVLDSVRELRDLQIHEKTLATQPEAKRLEAFRRALKKRRKRRQSQAKAVLDAVNDKKQALAVQTLGEHLLKCAENPLAEKKARKALKRMLTTRFRRFERLAQSAREEDPASLHRARIAFKKFRYAWETLSPLYPIPTSSARSLKTVQKNLGGIQDAVILGNLLMEFLVEYHVPHPDSSFRRFLHKVEQTQERGVARFIAERDQLLRKVRPPMLLLRR